MMQTTQITTWCCHEDDDNLFNLEDEDSDSVPIPVMQESTEKRLKVYKGFHKPNAVHSAPEQNSEEKKGADILSMVFGAI